MASQDATLWTLSTQGPGAWVCVNWKAAVLFATGFLGGIFSSISGSGIDICSFAVLTLLFRVSEKTATPTSVILMAINTWVGFLYRQFGQGGVMVGTHRVPRSSAVPPRLPCLPPPRLPTNEHLGH